MSVSTNILGYLAAGPVASTPTTANPPTGGLSLYFADDTKVLLAWNGTTYVEQLVSPLLDALGSTQGDVVYRGATGWVVLSPGTTGQVLQSGGASADPSWVTPSGGTVTSIVAGAGLAGGTITGTGTVSLAAIGDALLLANTSGTTAPPVGTDLSNFFDYYFSSALGGFLGRYSAGWAPLAIGTPGQVLEVKTEGTANFPVWVSALPSASTASVLTGSGTAGIAASVALSDLLAISSGTLTLAGAALHEKLVLPVLGTLSVSTVYAVIPIADTIVIPASWAAPNSEAVVMTPAVATATTLTVSSVHSGTTSTVGTVAFPTLSSTPVLTGPTAAVTLVPGDFVFWSTGAAVDATLANLGFTMVASKH